jgi:agmatine deiminase
MPAEWEPHRATWLAWPSHEDLWREDLADARAEFLALCRGIVAPTGSTAGSATSECLEVLVPRAARRPEAEVALEGLRARVHDVRFGDIWLRDTAPSFQLGSDGALVAVCFRFNGWGGKYVLEGDEDVGSRVAEIAGARIRDLDLVLEGGGIEVDGEGTCLTTRQCVLNPNRNPALDEKRATELISDAVGAECVVWLERGLANDHTDGHIDTLARFVAPGIVACMEPASAADPNADVLREIAADLAAARDGRGRRFEIVTVPSPGAVLNGEGDCMPASYLNFYIANASVVVPTYGVANDDRAVAAIAACFPGRTVVGSPARAILTGGGAFHCITQQEPLISSAVGA